MDNPGTLARRAAVHTLEACSRGRVFEHALDVAVRGLDERDRRLAHELAAGVLRRQGALDARLAPLVTRGWSAVPQPLRAVLRLGAYQLTELDRVPVHAAVDTSVALARELSGARAAGFVNAVLRRLASDPALRAPPPIADSHPAWLLERWRERFGEADTRALVEWNDSRPRLAVQPAREELATLVPRWQAAGVKVEPAPFELGVYVDVRRPDQLEGFDQGAFLVQDPAQAMVCRFAGFGATTVYDACAAPGGKALGLARLGATVIAGDRSRLRVARMRQNLRRAGSGRELPLIADAIAPPLEPQAAVLLDAPCLGTGTFGRHPDARWRVSLEALATVVRRQAELLEALGALVRPGGMLVYATCSIEPEENEHQVDAFLASHPDFEREPNLEIPAGLVTTRGDLAILPQRHRMDGAFAARLRRTRA